MSPRDRELMEGMGNCYDACGASYPETVQMVASNRRRDPAEVEATLLRIATEAGDDPEFQRLRARLPAEFPF